LADEREICLNPPICSFTEGSKTLTHHKQTSSSECYVFTKH
jgi:hypothetical protein